MQKNTADVLLASDGKLNISGYAELDYNQPLESGIRRNGKLDIHRLVMLFGYNFNRKTQFITEIEYEHVKEVFIEQAFVQHSINKYFKLRAGLMLIPMGIVNEYHEPTTFNGVERPLIDKVLAPTTWRELGLGFTGRLDDYTLKYQFYLFNGFNGYDGSGTLNGKNGLRKGRQKGAESFISSPNISFKIDHYGIRGLKLGLAGYFGNTQSTLYNNLDVSNDELVSQADSSVVNVKMLGLDFRYKRSQLEMRGQFIYADISNTEEYNTFVGSDLGSAMMGYYIEGAYNILPKAYTSELLPFVRYSSYDTHFDTSSETAKNPTLKKSVVTAGLTYRVTPGVSFKIDYQWFNDNADNKSNQFNLGVGIWFN